MKKNESPLISVITVVRNGEKFIGECLQNVVDQHSDNIEHVIIDGASTDKTLDIIKSFASRYSHIRFISEPDKCQSEAMNKGLRLARAKIVGFLNYDDLYEPGVLNSVSKKCLTISEPTIFLGNCRLLDGEGNTASVQRPVNFSLGAIIERDIFPYNPSAYFYHKTLHQIAGDYPLDDDYAMDLYFLIRAAAVAKIMYFDEPWGIYRLHEKSKTYGQNMLGETEKNNDRIIWKYIESLPPRRLLYYTLRRMVRKARNFLRIRERGSRLFRLMGL